MSDQDTRSKRWEQIQRERKLRRREPSIKYKKTKVVEDAYTRKQPTDLEEKIVEALNNLEI